MRENSFAMGPITILIYFYIISVFRKITSDALLHEGLKKVLLSSYTNVRTVQLLNQLCNDSQDADDSVARDACYGCFFRASNQPSGYPLLLSMSACADSYLATSSYVHCSVYLKNATQKLGTRATPNTIYCTFLECIRQVNKDTLIRNCIDEAREIITDFLPDDVHLAQLFVNTTACILAKTRCGAPNPITGAIQDATDIPSKLSIPSINAILVNSNYDINIVQLPLISGSLDECSKYRHIQQASWPSVQCYT